MGWGQGQSWPCCLEVSLCLLATKAGNQLTSSL